VINAFKDEYQVKKILSEIQILRQLTAMQGNVFTTKLLDLIATTNANDEMTYIYIVMDYVDSDLKKIFNTS
jgi:serine/threonine protein kinase